MHGHNLPPKATVMAGPTPRLSPTNRLNYFAIYIIPHDLWYIIPYSIIGRKYTSITLAPDMKGHKYERYKEAWHLLFRTRTRKRRRLILSPSRAPHQQAGVRLGR